MEPWVRTSREAGQAQVARPVMLVVAVLLSTLTLTTVVGNLLVGLALIRFPRLRTVSNFLIGNLALSDLLLAVTVLPPAAAVTVLPISDVNNDLRHKDQIQGKDVYVR